MSDKPSICIIGLKCYDLLAGAETPRYIGGIENQLVLLARGLTERGYRVSFVTFDHGQPDGVACDGIRIFKAFESDAGIRGLRFIHPRWTGLCAAMKRADADVYYQMGAGCETGQIAMWCRKHGKRFVFAAASDSDCVTDPPLLGSRREKILFRYGLKAADTVVAQTRKQQDLLSAEYGIASELLGIFTPEPKSHQNGDACGARVVWVGRISPEKRPHLLTEVVRGVPGLTVDVVGNANADTEYAREFRRSVEQIPAIVLHGKVSAETLDKLYSQAVGLLNTSETEGFPVTFIEAWSRGVPVVSTFDPDDVIARHGLGWAARTVDDVVRGLKELLGDPERRKTFSAAARSYYLDNHAVDICVKRFAQLLDAGN